VTVGWSPFRARAKCSFQALPGSALPAKLTELGWHVAPIGTSERILPNAITQKLELSSSGALVAPTAGSTRATALVVTNAGIAIVEQFDLRMP
jgi:hypothetical protein